MTPGFSDYFSAGADAYARFRPWYPAELLARLAALAPGRACCWDVATGTGQAARGLAEHFERVIATDASARQIAHATPHPRIDYRVEVAERSSLADASVDLITIAAGLHWFDLPGFYAEVRRVARPGAVIAAWSYGADLGLGGELDRVVDAHVKGPLGPYWPDNHRHIRSAYRTLEFPFTELEFPPTPIVLTCTLDDILGVIGTWSATALYRADTGRDPSIALRAALAAAWGPAPVRVVEVPLFFRVGRVEPAARLARPHNLRSGATTMRTTTTKQTISTELAHAMIAAAEAKGAELGLAVAVTIVDESGVLKAFSRMDGAPLMAVSASRKKALTAVGFGLPTGATWHDFIKDDPILLHGAQHLDDFILLGGGLPIVVDGALVGAIGVSGGHYEKDEQVARAATALLAASA